MKVSSIRFFVTAALALVATIAAVALFPLSTQAAGLPRTSPNAPAPAWYSNCPYVVADGDDLYRIAMRFGVTPYVLSSNNGLYNPNVIYRGMVMQVPCNGAYPQSNYQSSRYPNYGTSGYGMSGYGNYMQPYGSSGYQSQGYSSNFQPQGYPSNYQSQGYSSNYQSMQYNVCSVHFVRFGEWLKMIASRFGVPWQSIAAMNRMSNPNFIFAGERLLIPCAQSSGYSPYSAPSSGYRAPSSGYPTSPSVYPTPPPTAGSVTATMMNIMFSPATITIRVGQSVMWHNMDSVQHSATQGTCSGNTCAPAAGGFDTGILNPGQTSAAIMFNTAGTFHFYCRVHGAMMQGDVVVMP
jgi:plastocyanin